ncbi:MAG: PRC-barrel domain containing protein [Halobacteriota archaeon]
MSQLTEADEGKDVVDAAGETVGIITNVRHGTAYVDTDPSITESLKAKLGWGDVDDDGDTYPLEDATIASITDEEIRLSDNLRP